MIALPLPARALRGRDRGGARLPAAAPSSRGSRVRSSAFEAPREWSGSMPDRLEQRLAALAAEIEFPPTPDLAPAGRPRASAEAAPRRRLVRPARRSLALALAALALLAAGRGSGARRARRGRRPTRSGRSHGRARAAASGLARRDRPRPARHARRGRRAAGLPAARAARPPAGGTRRRVPARPWPPGLSHPGLPALARALPDPVPRRPEPRPHRQVHRPGHRHEARARGRSARVLDRWAALVRLSRRSAA